MELSASRRGDTVFLQAVNTDLHARRRAVITAGTGRLAGGVAHVIAPPVSASTDDTALDAFDAVSTPVPPSPAPGWVFPKASVTALELRSDADAK